MRRSQITWKLPLIFVAAAFVFDLGFFAAGLVPPRQDPALLPKVKLMVVPTGGIGRVREALQLFIQGKAEWLLISGTDENSSLEEILKANSVEMPEPLKKFVVLDVASRTTTENAIEIRRAIEDYDAQSVTLITSNYHMRRAVWLLENELRRYPPLTVQIYTMPVDSPNFPRGKWMISPTSWKILFGEYIGSIPHRLDQWLTKPT